MLRDSGLYTWSAVKPLCAGCPIVFLWRGWQCLTKRHRYLWCCTPLRFPHRPLSSKFRLFELWMPATACTVSTLQRKMELEMETWTWTKDDKNINVKCKLCPGGSKTLSTAKIQPRTSRNNYNDSTTHTSCFRDSVLSSVWARCTFHLPVTSVDSKSVKISC